MSNIDTPITITLDRMMTPPPPTTSTTSASSSLAGLINNFYQGSKLKKDQTRYAVNFHSGSSNNFEDKSHFNKNSHILSNLHKHVYDEKAESSKRYAMNFHSGASNNFNTHRSDDETSTSGSNIVNDYTSSTTNHYDTTLYTDPNRFLDQNTNNFHTNNHNQHNAHLSGKGFSSSSNTATNQVGHLTTKQQHHLRNIKKQLLQNTGFSNSFPDQAHHNTLNSNHLGTGSSNTHFQHQQIHDKPHIVPTGASSTLTSRSRTVGVGLTTNPAATTNTGFGAANNPATFPTTASATVGASITFSQNSDQFQNNFQQPNQQQINNNNWNYNNNNNQNYNNNNQQVNYNTNFQQNQQHAQQAYPTGFDPRSQSKLPWGHNRFPTQYRVASASAPSGGAVPFAHHQLLHHHNRFNQHGSTGASAPGVRPPPGQILPVTQSPISPAFGFGTTGNQYAAVRDPSQMPAAGRQEKSVTQPSVPVPQTQQTPPPPLQSTTRQSTSTTTSSTTTKRIEKIQDTTEPVAAASEAAESKFVESSTSRAGYGWGPEGSSSGGNEEGVR